MDPKRIIQARARGNLPSQVNTPPVVQARNSAAVREQLEVLQGQRGNPMDRAVRQRELDAQNERLQSAIKAAQTVAPADGIVSQTLAPAGEIVFANGFKFQWGSFTSNSDSYQTVPFTAPFATACFGVQLPVGTGHPLILSTTEFQVDRLDSVDGDFTVYWLAYGV